MYWYWAVTYFDIDIVGLFVLILMQYSFWNQFVNTCFTERRGLSESIEATSRRVTRILLGQQGRYIIFSFFNDISDYFFFWICSCLCPDPHLSRKSKADCLDCGGKPIYPFNWRKGKWLAGVPASPVWRYVSTLTILSWWTNMNSNWHSLLDLMDHRMKAMIPKYTVANDTISFIRLNNLLQVVIHTAKIHMMITFDWLKFSLSWQLQMSMLSWMMFSLAVT
jgi:hypothetical protein